ncbi:hypothetical protein LP419_40960 [Massilia sp. H-1]|nr:hypothetical protein LP419_40960 [Massilia sp. H-1]
MGGTSGAGLAAGNTVAGLAAASGGGSGTSPSHRPNATMTAVAASVLPQAT